MFDTVTGNRQHLPSHATLPILVSTTAQAIAVTAVLVLPALFVADQIPEVPTMLAFVAPPPPPPAPPPPPRPAPAKPVPQAKPVPSQSELVAPIEAPKTIEPEPAAREEFDAVPGGVEGGVPGGIAGGVVGGLPEAPPPPPPPAAPRGPVRIGGQIQAPTLLHRVEPNYPPVAVDAHLQGLVILEAIVDRDGTVAEVKVLRSANGLLDREAVLAVKQWRYSPLILNGQRERFVLTVTLSFHLESGS